MSNDEKYPLKPVRIKERHRKFLSALKTGRFSIADQKRVMDAIESEMPDSAIEALITAINAEIDAQIPKDISLPISIPSRKSGP